MGQRKQETGDRTQNTGCRKQGTGGKALGGRVQEREIGRERESEI